MLHVKTNDHTVGAYLEHLKAAFLFSEARRWDVKGNDFYTQTAHRLSVVVCILSVNNHGNSRKAHRQWKRLGKEIAGFLNRSTATSFVRSV